MSIFKGIANVGFAALGAALVAKEACSNTGIGAKVTELKDKASAKKEAYAKLYKASQFLKDGKITEEQFSKFKLSLFPEAQKAEEASDILLLEITTL